MKPQILTLGYEGLTPESFVTALKDAGVQVLVDIRWTPISRKPGFSKSALWALLINNGIEYRHLRDLGAPKHLRTTLTDSGDFRLFAAGYRKHLSSQLEALRLLTELAISRRVCVMCVEADPEGCHRSLVVQRMLNDSGIQSQHLMTA